MWRRWNVLAAVAAATVLGVPASGEPPSGRADRVTIDLRVEGHLFAPVAEGAEPVRQPISLAAEFEFEERPEPSAGTGGAARRYSAAAASIDAGGGGSRRLLAADARDVLVALEGTTTMPYLGTAFLSREEAELLDVPFDPILVERLRPEAAVAIGTAWKIPGDLAAGLVAIDRIDSGGIEVTLEAVDEGTARLTLAGTLVGAVDGVPTRVEVKGGAATAATAGPDAGTWRLEGGSFAELSVEVSERREAGWVSPGLDVRAQVTMRRPAGPSARAAGEPGLGPAAADRPQGQGRPGLVWHRHRGGRYALVLDGRWRVVEDGPEGLVMRFVDRGALVAQCSLLPLPRSSAAAAPTEETVRADVRRSLGGQFGHLVESEATSRGDGTRMVRVVADGSAEGRRFRWIHHVLTGPDGHQAAVTFMLEPALADRFAAADHELVAGLVLLPDPPARSAAARQAGPR